MLCFISGHIQSCTGSLSGFQSLSFFCFPSLAMVIFFPPTQGHMNTEKHMHTHINTPHQHNSCWKGNLMLAPVMNIHPQLFPAESFQQVSSLLRRNFGPELFCLVYACVHACACVCVCTCVSVSVFSTAVVSFHLKGSTASFFFFLPIKPACSLN